MEKLETLKENVTAAYETGDESRKDFIKQLWPDLFMEDPYLKACKLLGETPLPPLADRSNKRKVSVDAYERLTVCIAAKNMVDGKVWEPVLDCVENHWYPVWQKRPSGFGLAFDGTDYWDTFTFVGARLEYRTEKLLLEGVKEFEQYYMDLLRY